MVATTHRQPWVPPRWFKRAAWRLHRWLYRVTGGRRGLRRPAGRTSGLLRLRTVGRKSGVERAVMLAYFEDGSRFVTLAMNGWDDPAPLWWLNLIAHPDAAVDTVDGPIAVRGRAAEGEERRRLWAAFGDYDGWGAGIDRFAALRSHETPVVVLERREN